MSNYLKNKSVTNLDAAMKLKESPNYHHCSSIHCSYYSCFQVVKYIIISSYSETEDTMYRKRKSESERQQSEHEFVIEYIYRKLVEANELLSAKDFKNNIGLLKGLRINSDYKDILMEKNQSDKAYDLAEGVLKILKKHYKHAS